eukprot:267481-Amphidinium_carterae.1
MRQPVLSWGGVSLTFRRDPASSVSVKTQPAPEPARMCGDGVLVSAKGSGASQRFGQTRDHMSEGQGSSVALLLPASKINTQLRNIENV